MWRRSYNTRPPPMTEDHPHHDDIETYMTEVRGLEKEDIPACESLEDLVARTVPYFRNVIGKAGDTTQNRAIFIHP